jgi:hypothetical protein
MERDSSLRSDPLQTEHVATVAPTHGEHNVQLVQRTPKRTG